MADSKAPNVAGIAAATQSEMQRKRTAARAVTSEKVSRLDDDDQYALRQVRQAKSALTMAQERLVNGKGCTVEFLQACATLNHAAAGLFSQR